MVCVLSEIVSPNYSRISLYRLLQCVYANNKEKEMCYKTERLECKPSMWLNWQEFI